MFVCSRISLEPFMRLSWRSAYYNSSKINRGVVKLSLQKGIQKRVIQSRQVRYDNEKASKVLLCICIFEVFKLSIHKLKRKNGYPIQYDLLFYRVCMTFYL